MGILQFPVGSVYFNIPDGVYSAKSTYKIELLENVIVEHGKTSTPFLQEVISNGGKII